MEKYPIGKEFIITVEDCAIVQGYFTNITEEKLTVAVLEVLSGCYKNTTIPYTIEARPEEILEVKEVKEKILKPFKVTWWDEELEYEDSEIVHARCWQDAEQTVSEGNEYAVDIESEEVEEEVPIL